MGPRAARPRTHGWAAARRTRPCGRSVAAGDINVNGDGDRDGGTVIGQPVAAESGGTRPGGEISPGPGTPAGFTTAGTTTLPQDTASVPGGNESGDVLATSVSVGDHDADGCADVLAGAPGETLTRGGTGRADAGNAILVRGTPAGLTGSGVPR
ncbi:hypothetical protein ACPF8X_37455, partial [Streptomyces sp. G35A]